MTAKFKAYLKTIGFNPSDTMAPLAGINELRALVNWASWQREDDHEYMTPADLLRAYRNAK